MFGISLLVLMGETRKNRTRQNGKTGIKKKKKNKSEKSTLMVPIMNIMSNQNQWSCTGNLC